MPGKSRYNNKVKHPHQSKKSKAIQRQGTVQRKSAIDTTMPALAAVPQKAGTIKDGAQIIQHPYIVQELRRIGLLAGIILVILIVLAVILS
jgi:hypothetical protein